MSNYQIISQKNPNLGWWFYKGYYKGGLDWSNLKSKEEDKSGVTNNAYFKDANKILTGAKLPQINNGIGNYISVHKTTYPGLVMGVGYQHETGAMGEAKIGFSFDYSTGLPCIAGSSVKGIIRYAFPQFKSLDKNLLLPDSKNENKNQNNKIANIKTAQAKADYIANILGWNFTDKSDLYNAVYILEQSIFAGVEFEKSSSTAFEYKSIYKRDIFFDAFPIEATAGKLLGEDYITPHVGGAQSKDEIIKKSLKEPIPILFLKVMPDVTFRFDFKVFDQDIIIGNKTVSKTDRENLYTRILNDFGVGAKTNVGYGQFVRVEAKEILSSDKKDVDEAVDKTEFKTELENKTVNTITPEFFQHKTTFKPDKRYELDAVVTKSGIPNFISVYVQEGDIQSDIKLDLIKSAIEIGKVIKVTVDFTKQGKVRQASYKGVKQ